MIVLLSKIITDDCFLKIMPCDQGFAHRDCLRDRAAFRSEGMHWPVPARPFAQCRWWLQPKALSMFSLLLRWKISASQWCGCGNLKFDQTFQCQTMSNQPSSMNSSPCSDPTLASLSNGPTPQTAARCWFRQEAGITAAMVHTPETNNSTSTWSLSMHSTFNLRRFTSGGKSPRGIEGRVPCLLRLEREKHPARWKQNTKKCTSTGRFQNFRAAKMISLGQSSRRSVPGKWDDLNDWSFLSHAFFVAHPPSKSPITRPVALLQCFQFHQLTLKSHVFQNPRPNLRLGDDPGSDAGMTMIFLGGILHVRIPQKMRGSRKLVGWIVFVTPEINVCLILSVENPARSLIHPSRYCRFSTLSQLKKHNTWHIITYLFFIGRPIQNQIRPRTPLGCPRNRKCQHLLQGFSLQNLHRDGQGGRAILPGHAEEEDLSASHLGSEHRSWIGSREHLNQS